MFRRPFHVAQVEFLPLVARQPRKQVDIAHHRSQRGLDVVRDGQHQLLARLQQRLLVAVGALQLAAVTVAAIDVAPKHPDEQEHQHHGPDGHAAQDARRPSAESLVALDTLHQVGRVLGLEVHDQAVYLRIDQFVAVTQPQPLLPRMVVDALPVARDAVLQGLQHQHDGVLHRVDGDDRGDGLAARDHEARIGLRGTEQIAQPLEKAAFGARHGRRVLPHDAAERDRIGHDGLPGTDQTADVLVQQARRGPGADRTAQAHRAALLVGDQPRDAVQTHRLQRIPADGQRPERVDRGPHGTQFPPVTRLVRGVSGDHQLSVAFGLVEVVEGPVDGAALGMQQSVTAVGRRETDRHPVDVAHRENTDRNQQEIARHDLRFDEFRLLHRPKYTKKPGNPRAENARRHDLMLIFAARARTKPAHENHEKALGTDYDNDCRRAGGGCLLPVLLRLRRGRQERRTELRRLQGRAFQDLRRQTDPDRHPLESRRVDPVLRVRVLGRERSAGARADAARGKDARTAL